MNSANTQKAVKPFLSSDFDRKCALEGKKINQKTRKKEHAQSLESLQEIHKLHFNFLISSLILMDLHSAFKEGDFIQQCLGKVMFGY